jgi:Domain of unknown function (DUF4397)
MRRLLAALFVLSVALVATPPAAAAPAGWIRLAHLSPDAFDVDVYVAPFRGGNQIVLKKVGYGDVSSHQRLAPGRYTISMRKAGASSAAPAILSTEVDVAEGAAYTVAGMGMAKELRLQVLRDQLAIPPSGRSLVRVIQASAQAKQARVTVGDASAGPLNFASASSYLQVPAGRLPVAVQPEGAAAASKQDVDIAAGAVYSLAVLDAPRSGIEVVRLLDAAGSGRMPARVNAGYGGAAPDAGPAGPPGAVAAAAVAGLVLGAGLLVTVRRRQA